MDPKSLLHNLDKLQSQFDDLCQDSGLRIPSIQGRLDSLQSETESHLDSWKEADAKSKRLNDLLYEWSVLMTKLQEGVPALQEVIQNSTFNTFDQAKVISTLFSILLDFIYSSYSFQC